MAATIGVHPNTLRWYEAAGYLPPVPRTPAGYRQYSAELIRLARIVRESQPLLRLYGPIRSTTLAFLRACKEDTIAAQDAAGARLGGATVGTGPYGRSLHQIRLLAELLQSEHHLALEALGALERFRRGGSTAIACVRPERGELSGESTGEPSPRRGRLVTVGAAAVLTGLSRDRIINWERNGLGRYPRSTAGYRLLGAPELDRLLIIRSCRTAGYSITAIRRLLRAADTRSADAPLRTVADTPAPHETELFPVFPTDTLPATLEAMIALTVRLHALLEN